MGEFKLERIKELRIKNKMSQKTLGNYLGISDRAVSKWELGLSKPSGENLIHLAKLFKVPIEYFLNIGVIQTMKETGLDMHTAYKETSEAGLAKIDI